MTVYISGPMTGLPEFNYPAFYAAAAELKALGHEPLNPAEVFGGDKNRTREEYMRADIALVCRADAILLLPDWHKSRGARLEVQVASEIGLRFLTLEDISQLKAA